MTNAELEAAILADPDARDGYAVYADWLEQEGDPRGELISVQLAREDRPDDAVLVERERALLAEHADRWLSWLAHSMSPFRKITVTWRRGFVTSADVPTAYESEDAAHSYRELAPLPIARFLRELRLGTACSYGGGGDDDVSILEALRDFAPPLLRTLAIDSGDHQLSWTHVGDVSIANASLRELEELDVIAGRATLGDIDLPNLRKLRIETGGLRAHVLDSIARAAWPRLESLVIYLGTDDYGGTCTPRDVRAILDGANLPAVTDLALCNGTFGDELAELVIGSRILPRLRRLDLSKGTMGDDGARALLANAAALSHLESLDVSENYLAVKSSNALGRAFRGIHVSGQKTEERYGRFVSVSE